MACMSLSQRIQLEQGKRQPSEIKELNLDRSKAAAIEGLSEDFSNLESLSLANVGLESLSGLPKLQALRNLELSGNCISDGLESLVNCPNLVKLNLSANKIDSVEALTPLAKLSNLRSLDLTNCEVAAIENYRKTVFAALPNLKYLDGTDENNESEPESEEQDCIVANGANGGNDEEAAENDDEDDEHESDEDEEDEEEYGIEALQRSDDLEDDDEEDYAPGAEEEVESEDYDDDFDEDEEDDSVQDDGANLSGAGVTGPRRPGSKRPLEGVDDDDESSAAKQKPDVDASADE